MATQQRQERPAAAGEFSGTEPFMVDGNRLTPIVEGKERLQALLDLIGSARRDLRLLYYIFSGDTVGQRIRDALIEARGRGVAVSLLVDGFGSQTTPDSFFEPLRAAGCSVCRFLPRFGRRYLLRNHQKLALADGERVLIGGFNIEDDYFAEPEQDGWRDFGLLVEGPAAGHLVGYFDAVIGWAQDPRASIFGLSRILKRWSQRQGRLRWLFGGPANRLSTWARAFRRDLARGRSFHGIAAYFTPNAGTIRRIGRKARRGTVRLITAARSDNTMTVAAARATYVRLLERGAGLWEYQRAKLHTKLYVFDRVSYVGSANLDMRSLYLNCEIMLRIDDQALADALRGYILRETQDGHEVSLARIRERAGLWMRFKWRIAYFLVGIVDYTVTRRMNFTRIGSEIG